MTSTVSSAARTDLAPGGTLRVGLNHGNFLLVTPGSSRDAPRGVAPDLARELARRLGVPLAFVTYETAGKMADAAVTGAWDVAFLGAEPQRAGEIAFTAAYLEIPSTYLVPAGSPLRSIAEVDRDGVKIAVAAKAAYDLWLSRNLKHATLVRAEGIDASYDVFVSQRLDALSGLKPRLVSDAEKLPGSRILEGQFTAVQQAIGTPRAPRGRSEIPARIRRGRQGLGPGGKGDRRQRRARRVGRAGGGLRATQRPRRRGAGAAWISTLSSDSWRKTSTGSRSTCAIARAGTLRARSAATSRGGCSAQRRSSSRSSPGGV